MKNTIIEVYTDGSLIKKDGKVYCGYGIYFPNNEYKSISRKFTHEPITNNRAELYAILKVLILCNIINLKRIKKSDPEITQVNIYSDSEYSVKTFNEWLPKWKKTKKIYLNADIIDEIDELLQNVSYKVKFNHVRSHTGKNDFHSICNNKADELAKARALKK